MEPSQVEIFDEVLISQAVLETLKILTWFLASINEYYCQALCLQFVDPCCSLIPLPCPEAACVVHGKFASRGPLGYHHLCRAVIPAIISEDLVIRGSLQTSLK